jgi:hypothetical protein
MAAIGHVTKPGHKCRNPFPHTRAGNIQMGERLQLGAWELWASKPVSYRGYVYIVCRVGLTGDHYEFLNFNCAAAKLAELGR